MERAVQDVLALSDDEQRPATPQTQGTGPAQQALVPKRMPAKRKLQAVLATAPSAKVLRARVQGSCGCKCSCFKPFRDDTFEQLMKILKTMSQLAKPEQDSYVHPSEV